MCFKSVQFVQFVLIHKQSSLVDIFETDSLTAYEKLLRCNESKLELVVWIVTFLSFLYNGECFNGFKLSVSDIIVSQKSSNGDGQLQFFGEL